MNELSCAETVMPFRRRVRRAWTTTALLEVVGAAMLLCEVGTCVVEPRMMCMRGESKVDIAKLETQKLANEAYPLNDPWGSGYQLSCDAKRIRVWSLGEDRIANTSDDIRSWE